MHLDVTRLRRGELTSGTAALVLLVLMLGVHWYGRLTGWQALTGLRWLAVVTIAAAFALTYFQAACRAPALPATLSVIVIVLAAMTALWLAVDVVLNHPAHQRIWAVVGLLAACAVLYGAFRSLRQEGVSTRDELKDIPTVEAVPGVPS